MRRIVKSSEHTHTHQKNNVNEQRVAISRSVPVVDFSIMYFQTKKNRINFGLGRICGEGDGWMAIFGVLQQMF